MSERRVLGLDIGGANLKASDGERSVSMPFPLWERPAELVNQLQTLLNRFPPDLPIAATMTGELADCFPSRAAGVQAILTALAEAADRRSVGIWQTAGELVDLQTAADFPELTAAANWHALATWVGRAAPESCAMLIDIGSTTTDLIPLEQGFPATLGGTDLSRLCTGELVYTGVKRTPLFALTSRVRIGEEWCGVAAELFATTLDLGVLLGDIPADEHDCGTANGRPATQEQARIRLARIVCADLDQLAESELHLLARQFREAQLELLERALQQVLNRLPAAPATWILAGEGEFLGQQLLQRYRAAAEATLSTGADFGTVLSLSQFLGREHSQAACAYALAKLGQERLQY